ncbi:MAG: hypothetical protein ACOXZ1_01725 [Patescibacteria group bacterium]|jgi:hypothetical protein
MPQIRKGFEQEQLEDLPISPEEEVVKVESQEPRIEKESILEKESEFKKEEKEEEDKLEKKIDPPSASPVTVILSPEEEREKKIDKILAEGLEDVFLGMTPKQQKKFKTEGEKTVKKINVLLRDAKVKIKKIVDLIRRWLRNIPKVNKHFLEQEAKIKADRIVNLKKEEKNK